MKRTIAFMLVIIMFLNNGTSQTKVGIFVPGYSLDVNVAWLNTGTPVRLVNEGVLDSYRVLTVPQFNTTQAMTSSYSAQFSWESERWMVIGHSLGGLVARIAEHPWLLSAYNAVEVQLKGIVTLGAPHQGLPLANNYTQAPNIIQSFSNDVLAGPAWETQNGGFLNWVLTQLSGGVPYYQRLASIMSSTKDAATNTVQQLSQYPLSELPQQLAPGGGFISSLQSIPATVPHVSVSGVEYSPAIVRWALSTDAIAGSALTSESNAASTFYNAKDDYNSCYEYHHLLEDYYYYAWLATPCWLLPGTCDYYWQESSYHEAGKNAWARGWWALDGIDNTWFQLANELLSATGSYSYWVDCAGGGEAPSVNPSTDRPMVPYDPCAYGEPGYWVTVYYTYYYADKSDALVPQNRAKWFAGDGFANASTPVSSLQQGNISFEVGYNNSEVRYLERPESGQPSEPMRYGRDWMNYWILRP